MVRDGERNFEKVSLTTGVWKMGENKEG